MTNHEAILFTKLAVRDRSYTPKREQRIREALAFVGGTIKHPRKHVVAKLPNGKEAYFLKPGKEAQRVRPNIHDMLPDVGKDGTSDATKFSFEDIWAHLLEMSIVNQILFKKVLVLIYRNCFFVDHLEENGRVIYSPSHEIAKCIEKIDYAVQMGFSDKFKKDESIGLLEFLHFVDLLGWNEDVKYHVENNVPNFKNRGKKNVGRPNTILSIISVPLMINTFLKNVIENVEHFEKINVRLILSTMQQLSKSRGVHTISHKKLQQELSPYLL